MERREARGGTLILGGGFAGSYVARLLKRHAATIVSPENFVLYTPLLPEAGAGTLEPRHVVVPLRQMCPHAELLLGRATALDAERSVVIAETLAGPCEILYERLVVARWELSHDSSRSTDCRSTAWASRTWPTRSLSATGFCSSSSGPRFTPGDASELGFVFVGAGYAGVEALAELNDLARAALRFYPNLRGAPQRWVLVDAAPKILPEIPRRLGEYASRHLARRGVEIHVSTTLESYDGHEAVLSDGTRVPRANAGLVGGRPGPSTSRRPRLAARCARARADRRDASR